MEFSNVTEQHILQKYPHLTKQDLSLFLNVGKIILHAYDPIHKNGITYSRNIIELHLPEWVVEDLNVDSVIGLVPDNEGVIYRKYL